ncbi:hypothetical protein [Aureibacter tunicatorum]|uniref:Transporter n=1 Tax=Aureibacter tunicatorum TaxID=866807 RepID=A0AAE4BR58_9BACT|nr:hypothetical protein [Aureibacter tunicatorum]MDR6237415.1 hypothetical protein [Aureibacter tunicatorum]BDD06405.1 hypothetical protein AUTU_38880 [Aureibacter tunicatorum]
MKTGLSTVLFALLLIFGININASAQGCSDAGICTAPSVSSGAGEEDGFNSSISLELPYGIGDDGVSIFSPTLVGTYAISPKTIAQIKLPFVFASGNLGSVSGLGDITTSLTRELISNTDYKLMATVGVRIGVNNADATENNKPLPMVYQTSLGTTDLLLGISAKYKAWLFALGYQQNLTGENGNEFLMNSPAWVGNEHVSEYPDSRMLNRKPDLMIRIERKFEIGKLNLYAGLLPIFHLGEDEYLDMEGNNMKIEGSSGLTLNANVNLRYRMADNIDLGLNIGAPLIVRETRPDGLTRAFVISPSIKFLF